VARNVPGVALYFTTLTRLREYIARPDSLLTHLRSTASSTIPTSAWPRLSVLGDITTGATARVAVGFILMPVTVVKARAESTLYPQTSIYRSMRALLAEGGVRALWQGFVPTSLRDGPYAGLFVLSYERSKMALNHVHLGGRPLPTGARDSAAGA
jgi:solute carrier family 25 protein 38